MKFIEKLKKDSLGWAFYDWANSAYATTVLAVFFPLFFNQYWSRGADTSVTTARLGIANSVVGLILMLTAPVMGTMSDLSFSKKRYLLYSTLLGSVFTALLYTVDPGNWFIALLFFGISSFGFSAGMIFYDSLLKSVAGHDELNFLSALGYSLGYLGGGLLLAFNIMLTLSPEYFGLSSQDQAIRFSFLTVAVWWIVFSLPLFKYVGEERSEEKMIGMRELLKRTSDQIIKTFRHISKIKEVYLFLLAYWLYIDGVDTIIRMAMDFGLSIGFEHSSLITALLITQFVGFPAALATGILFKGKNGAKHGIFTAIFIYFAVSIFGAFMRTEAHFYALAVTVGLVQGGIQSLSRSYFAYIIPEKREGEFFGFFNMIGKFAVILGPLFIALTGLILREIGFSADIASRGGIMSVTFFFLTGGFVFFFSTRVSKEN
ncbi:MAG: MFS transporter [Candidatus Delongbacteria bacterium]